MGEEGWRIARKVYGLSKKERMKLYGTDEIGDVLSMPYEEVKRKLEAEEERKFDNVTTETLVDIARILERVVERRKNERNRA